MTKKFIFPKIMLALALSFSLSLAAIAPAKADAIDPNQKTVPFCFKITNITTFTEYTILLHDTGRNRADYKKLSNECIAGYRFGSELVAIKNSDVPASGLPEVLSKNAETFFIQGTNLIRLPGVASTDRIFLDKSSPVEAVAENWEISLNGTKLEYKRLEVVYTYKGGVTEAKAFTDQKQRPAASTTVPTANTPVTPNNTSSNPVTITTANDLTWLWFVGVPLVALLAIGAILFARRAKS
jgi:hypothetical protein